MLWRSWWPASSLDCCLTRSPVTFVGQDAARELCESIAHISSEKVLIVTDATLVEIGLIDRIIESLEAVGLRWSTYSGVEPDPTFDQVEAGWHVWPT